MTSAGIALAEKILRLKEEVEFLTCDRDRLRRESNSYRQIANAAEDETKKRRVSYLKLEAKYEEERKTRFQLEMSLAGTHTPEPAVVKTQSSLVDVAAGTTEDPVETVCCLPTGSSRVEKSKSQGEKTIWDLRLMDGPEALEEKYEEERKTRFQLEMSRARTRTSEPAVTTRSRLVDVGVGTTQDPVDQVCHLPIGSSYAEKVKSQERKTLEGPTSRDGHQDLAHDRSDVIASQGNAPSSLCAPRIPEQQPRIAVTGSPTDSPLCTPASVVTPSVTPLFHPAPSRPLSLSINPNPFNENVSSLLEPLPVSCAAGQSRKPSVSFASQLGPKPSVLSQPVPIGISRYLRDTTNFQVTPAPLPIFVSRRALTRSYGLPGMGFLWASKDENHRFLLPTYEFNPDMPRAPGQPGLLLSCRAEMWENGPWTLFVKVGGGNKPRLNYAGEYKCHAVGKLTGQEFAAQAQSVKDGWGTKISEHKRHPAYRDMRARMTLRKRHVYEPTGSQVSEESERIKAKGYTSDLASCDVISAFERADEKIDVVKLVCVAYSHERARAYARAQVDYEQHLIDNPPTRKRKREDQGDDQHTANNKRYNCMSSGRTYHYLSGLLDGELSDLSELED